MRITSLRKICSNPQILALAQVNTKGRIQSKSLVKKILDTKQEKLFMDFLEVLYNSQNPKISKKIFKIFSSEYSSLPESEKHQYSDSLHKEIEKVQSLYTKTSSSVDDKFDKDAFFLSELPSLIKKLKTDSFQAAANQEIKVDKYSLQLKRVKEGLEEYHEEESKGFPHSVIQSDNSPKMVIIGCPRTDRSTSLNDFFTTMIRENVEIIIALNTMSDWPRAITYYEPQSINSLYIDGYKIACSEDAVLYEGQSATKKSEKKINAFSNRGSNSNNPRIVERTFTLTEVRTGTTKTIKQLHYENWSDKDGAPDLNAWWVLLQRQLELNPSSVAIHCQGGIGRTNAHAILTTLVSKVDALKSSGANLANQEFNVPLTMLHLKEQAPRLGGAVSGERFAQIYEMLYRYFTFVQ